VIGRQKICDQRLYKRLEAEGVALWSTDRSSGVSDGHRVLVLCAVKLETKDVSQRERCIRTLGGRVSEKGEVKCLVVSCTRAA